MTSFHPHHIWLDGYTVIEVEAKTTRYSQVCPECMAWRHRQGQGRWLDGAGNKSVFAPEE